MVQVTFDHLDELSPVYLDQIAGVLARSRNRTAAHAQRVAQLFDELFGVLDDERARRQAALLPHSARSVTVALSTAGELSDAEVRDVMRTLQQTQTAVGGGTPAVQAFCRTVLDALAAGLGEQRDVLARMERDLDQPPAP